MVCLYKIWLCIFECCGTMLELIKVDRSSRIYQKYENQRKHYGRVETGTVGNKEHDSCDPALTGMMVVLYQVI